MKLYYAKGACSFAVRILINELNLPFEFERVDSKTKMTANGVDYLTINPKGKVPTIEFDDKTVLTEAAVILQYLADTHYAHEVLPASGLNRYRVLEWLNFLSTDVHKTYSPMFSSKLPTEVKENFFIPMLRKRFDVIEAHLKTRQMLFNQNFTIADCYLFVMISWMRIFKIEVADWPSMERYFNELSKRPSIVKSVLQEK